MLLHAVRDLHATDGVLTALVGAPRAAGEVTSNDHLDRERLAETSHGDHRVGGGKLPVGDDVGGGVEKHGGNLVEHLSLIGDALGQDNVESRDAVGGDHHHVFVVDEITIADLAVIDLGLARELIICSS